MTAPTVRPGDAFLISPLVPRTADLRAGGGFGVVVTVNRKRNLCLVYMQNGAHGEIDIDVVRVLLLEAAA